jgi:hypothetical protein
MRGKQRQGPWLGRYRDSIPEVVDRDCAEGKGCVIKRLQKWNGKRFVGSSSSSSVTSIV